MTPSTRRRTELAEFLLTGIIFGIVITRAEVISWFRLQEMFRFQGFHMFGIFGTALPVAIATVQSLKRRNVQSLSGERITTVPKAATFRRYAIGGTIFGMGWAFAGACPGPLFALVGSGVSVMAAAIVSALAGTWTYGALRERLPH
jgi:uncharacterized membrane protein YedE/YeeE